MELVSLDLGELAREVCRTLRETGELNQALIRMGELPRVRANRDGIRGVLRTLVKNAARHPRGQPVEIHIQATAVNGWWRVSVSDDGRGIPSSEREDIFQSPVAVPTKGLPLCRAVIESHRGQMWVESSFGRGSTFFFTLPQGGRVG